LKLPVIDITEKDTGYFDEFFDSDTNDNILGERIHKQRGSTFIDRFILLQSYNPRIHAGTAIKLNIYTMSKDGDQLSTTYAGLYVVEENEAVWDGESNKAYTKLIIGRKYFNVPNSKFLKGKLK